MKKKRLMCKNYLINKWKNCKEYQAYQRKKQSRMLLSQAGFTPDSKDDEAFRQKMDELAALRKQIGKTGFRILRPLVQDGSI